MPPEVQVVTSDPRREVSRAPSLGTGCIQAGRTACAELRHAAWLYPSERVGC